MVPGFLTDALGLLLLLPPVRRALIAPGRGAGDGAGDELCAGPTAGPAPAETIEADYEIVVDDTRPPPGGSGWTRPSREQRVVPAEGCVLDRPRTDRTERHHG